MPCGKFCWWLVQYLDSYLVDEIRSVMVTIGYELLVCKDSALLMESTRRSQLSRKKFKLYSQLMD